MGNEGNGGGGEESKVIRTQQKSVNTKDIVIKAEGCAEREAKGAELEINNSHKI